MLEAVGHPVAVNPDRVLAKVARQRDWEVMQFTKPVRLRDRVSVPSWSMTAAAAGITAAASVGALVAWRLATAAPGIGGLWSGARRASRLAQEGRSRLAATTPRATMMARIRSFFMSRDGNRSDHVPLPHRLETRSAQTVRRSRAPVSDEGWRSLDMARASI